MKKIVLLVIFSIFSVLQLQAQEIKDSVANTKWTTTKISEAEFRKYFDKNKENLDPIEGIYSMRVVRQCTSFHIGLLYDPKILRQYRIAIINRELLLNDEETSYEFVGIIIESDYADYLLGTKKLYLRKTSFNKLYESKIMLNTDKGLRYDFKFSEKNIIYTEPELLENSNDCYEQMVLIRVYPPLSDNQKKVKSETDNKENVVDGGQYTGSDLAFQIKKKRLVDEVLLYDSTKGQKGISYDQWNNVQGGENITTADGRLIAMPVTTFSGGSKEKEVPKPKDISNLKEEIRKCNEAIANNPNDQNAYYNRGKVKHEIGDSRGACNDWSKAGELGMLDAYDLINQFCK